VLRGVFHECQGTGTGALVVARNERAHRRHDRRPPLDARRVPLMFQIDERLRLERGGSIAPPMLLTCASGPVMHRASHVASVMTHGWNTFLFVDLVRSAATFSSSARFFRSAASRAGASRWSIATAVTCALRAMMSRGNEVITRKKDSLYSLRCSTTVVSA